ncbi:PLEKHH1 [Cordylochernes scorpioides]|uniref:PLEKHH1 n=1 Tax=Cordylochernes scorpioides TaxID=51811 RepID=A0ABY6LUL1_9ARAC|nr:PLEKHH1 [Cordylochernes scorpioides]
MLPWPPYSPDLSPIEHVWDIIGRRLHALPQPRSEDELWQMVEREWRAIPQDAIPTLIGSLPRRVAACIAESVLVQVVGFDGSSTVRELVERLAAEICMTEPAQSGFALFKDDPIDKTLEHCVPISEKVGIYTYIKRVTA